MFHLCKSKICKNRLSHKSIDSALCLKLSDHRSVIMEGLLFLKSKNSNGNKKENSLIEVSERGSLFLLGANAVVRQTAAGRL